MRGLIYTLVLAAALPMLGLTACSPPVSPPALTIAATATSADPQVRIGTPLRERLTQHATGALHRGDGRVRLVVQGRAGVSATVDLTPMRKADVESDPTKAAEKIADRLPALLTAVGDLHASTDGLDVLGVLDNALQITPQGGTVVVITSAISTTAPVDLRDAGDWLLQPERLAAAIRQADIPDARGRHIVFDGVGVPAPNGPQPPPGTAARTALVRLWKSVCQRTGAASCTVRSGMESVVDSVASNRVPAVTFDRVATSCVGTILIPGDVAFKPDSDRLTAAADQILAPIATSLQACPADRTVNAIGHAAEVPGGGDGMGLSRRRAIVTLRRLKALGAPGRVIGQATGVGNTRDQIVDNTPGNPGVYSERLAARNRVTELVISSIPSTQK